MQLFYQPDLDINTPFLDPEESRHAVKVLRLIAGKTITVTNGKGSLFECEIEEAHHKKTTLNILKETKISPSPTYRHIAIAPTKNLDRLEWFVEKAVEFGVDELSFILCQNSERKVLKTERLFKKAISAMKQSIKAYMPKINDLQKLKSFIETCDAEAKHIAYVDFSNPDKLSANIQAGQNNLVLIGPEGDFDEKEVTMALNAGFNKVSLGDARLRTETAGLAAVHLLNIFGK